MQSDNAVMTSERKRAWVYDLLLIVVLLAGMYFRFTGLDWGELQHQHPDELFFTSVTLDIQPVHSIAEYFNTAQSTLNPHNRGHGFYVYGTLPIFLVRYTAEWFGKLDNLKLYGRETSAVADLGTIVLLYFIAKRVYGRRVALVAAAFSALAVMQIQQSHFYTTDNFVSFFMFLTLYFAVVIAAGKWQEINSENPSLVVRYLSRLVRNPLTYLCLAFGLALGMAAASKINSVVEAIVLPVALGVRYFRPGNGRPRQEDEQTPTIGRRSSVEEFISKVLPFLVLGAITSILAFRLFQPYAFSGPGFFGLKPNPAWIANLSELKAQASPDADVLWSLQWARRSHLFSFQNLTVWGLGLPLGILAWAGFLWMGWRMLKGEWRQHVLLWSWTAAYFLWQSLQFNPTMRYQLPIYPLLAMMAAWVVFWFWDRRRTANGERSKTGIRFVSVAALVIGAIVLFLTAAWAFAFTRIYTLPETRIAASKWIYQNVSGPINLRIQTPDGATYNQPLPFSQGTTIQPGLPFETAFTAQHSGVLTEVVLGHAADGSASGVQTLNLSLAQTPDQVLATASVTADFAPGLDARGASYTLPLDHPIALKQGITYSLHLETTDGNLSLIGSAVTNETDIDWSLPFRVDGYDGFGGIYRGDLNLQVYWPDNADKLTHFMSTLDQADYIFVPTNHQYGQITRLPERYPLTTVYYRQLLGCPAEKNIIWCYRVAEPGMFKGNLGFDLVATFESYPTLGLLVINDQAAEEAFTFYDHPKVLIFQKRSDYDSGQVRNILGAVDLSHVVQLTPGQAGSYSNEMLTADRLAVQQAGGTWSELFSYQALQNRFPVIGLILWYLTIFAIGLFAYPIVRMALPGLADKGYPLARIAGLLLWAWFSWLAGSVGIPYSKLTIGVTFALVAVIGAFLAYRQRDELKQEWKTRRKYFLMVEGLFLAFFLLDLFVRIGNPDLWHDPDGGERPMDFSYFNAVLKSTTFPPYDPWFAGGYINYYYYGYVIVGTPVKMLGIVPSIAYNFILPTLYAILALGAFSVVWNLLVNGQQVEKSTWKSLFRQRAFIGGIAGSAALILLGNLGTARLFYRSFMCLAAPGTQLGNISVHDCIIAPGLPPVDKANIIARIWWTVKGFFLSLGGLNLQLSNREWMMTPSRALPGASGDPITEFPIFTYLWSDLHAHLIALPLTMLAIAWGLSVLLSKGKWKSRLDAFLGLFLGGLVIGALKPTNTWDFYTYLVLSTLVLFYAVVRYADVDCILPDFPPWIKRLLLAAGAAIVLVGLSILFYQPFSHWFVQAYNAVETWKGSRSDISSYLVHWGVFLFLIVSWMVWETRQWMAETPVSALRKLRPYRELIIAALGLIFLVLVVQQAWVMSPTQNVPWKGITILWLALPLAVWAAILLLRPGIPDGKRLILFMVGTSLLLTMVVEIIVLRGDVGRMNTVFKFYLQAWVMLGISAAAAFGWLLADIRKWLPGWRTVWSVMATVLVSCAMLYLFTAGITKIRDRLAPNAPHTLDSMTYMAFTQHFDFNVNMDLSEDYRAIRWMQDNIQGSPVIVEANCPEYRWCTRFTIYTGLPGVVGWNWHQRQQRVLTSNLVWDRVNEISDFYTTTDPITAMDFLRKYNVRYIIVGQLERAEYTGEGMNKFDVYNGIPWTEIYRDGQTVIYEVNP